MAATLIAAVTAAVLVTRARNHSSFVYPLDDTYIHLAVARDLAMHGTWGIVPGHYESASSSPLWTLLLALWAVVTRSHGLLEAPLILATLSSLWALWMLWRLLASARLLPTRRPALVGVGIAIVCAVIPLSLSGMEHALHLALLLMALRAATPMFVGGSDALVRRRVGLWLGLAMLCRYETLLVAVGLAIAIAVVARRRSSTRSNPPIADMGVVVLAPIIVALAYGCVNLAMGQGLLPNSVVARSIGTFDRIVDPLAEWHAIANNVIEFPAVLAVFIALGVVAATSDGRSPLRGWSLALAVAVAGQVALLEVENSSIYFFRYEAFLLGLATPILVGWLTRQRHAGRAITAFAYLSLALMALVSIQQTVDIPSESNEIHRQQQQTATFLSRYYPGEAAAVNDIGLVALMHRGPLVDLTGLASQRILEITRRRPLTSRDMETATRRQQVQVVAIFQSWFEADAIPRSWIAMVAWCLTGPIRVVGGRCVSFYATSRVVAGRLQRDLDAYRPLLPSSVRVVELGPRSPP